MKFRPWLAIVCAGLAACSAGPHGSRTSGGIEEGLGPRCAPIRDALWSSLQEAQLEAPATPGELRVDLPVGFPALPPAAADQGDCWRVHGPAALAPHGDELRLCCERTEEWEDDAFMRGCMFPSACRFERDGGGEAGTPAELAELLGGVETPAEALGLVALLHDEVLDPAVRGSGIGDFFGWQAYPDAPPAFAVEVLPDGFVVHAAAYAGCGCGHHLLRVAFHVSSEGCVEVLEEPREPLAYASVAVCVD
jgi:hypothetical protein